MTISILKFMLLFLRLSAALPFCRINSGQCAMISFVARRLTAISSPAFCRDELFQVTENGSGKKSDAALS